MDVMGRGQRGQEVLGAYLQVDKANHIKKVEKARLPTGERTTNNEPPLALRALAPANGIVGSAVERWSGIIVSPIYLLYLHRKATSSPIPHGRE